MTSFRKIVRRSLPVAAALLVLVAAGRIASRYLWPPAATAASVSYERIDTSDPNLVKECMRVSGQLLACTTYRRYARPHAVLVRVADGSAALTLPLSELRTPPARNSFMTVVSFGDARDIAPVTFDGGFGMIHLTRDQIEGAAAHGFAVGGTKVPAPAVAELYRAAQIPVER
jgi:hypothetical protein